MFGGTAELPTGSNETQLAHTTLQFRSKFTYHQNYIYHFVQERIKLYKYERVTRPSAEPGEIRRVLLTFKNVRFYSMPGAPYARTHSRNN